MKSKLEFVYEDKRAVRVCKSALLFMFLANKVERKLLGFAII